MPYAFHFWILKSSRLVHLITLITNHINTFFPWVLIKGRFKFAHLAPFILNAPHIIIDNPKFASIDQPLQALQAKGLNLINRYSDIVVVIVCIIF